MKCYRLGGIRKSMKIYIITVLDDCLLVTTGMIIYYSFTACSGERVCYNT